MQIQRMLSTPMYLPGLEMERTLSSKMILEKQDGVETMKLKKNHLYLLKIILKKNQRNSLFNKLYFRMSVTSSQKALSHCSGIRKRNAQLRTNIVDALNDNKPRWVTKNYPAESNMIVNQQYNAYGVSPFPKRK